MASSVGKLREQLLYLTNGKLDIQIDDNNFKSTYQILKELAAIWDEIGEKSDVTQANILNLLGGKRNANVLASILANFEDAIKATETASNAAGSALAENEKYLQGIEGKTKQVKAAFQEFANSVVGSGIVKSALDIASGFLSIATAMNKIHVLLPVVTALAIAIKTLRANAAANNAATQISSIMANGGDISTITQQVNGVVGSMSNMERRILMTKTAWVEYSATATAANVSNNALGVGVDALKVKTMGLGTALKSLKYSASFWIMIASVIISAISSIVGSINEAREKQKQLEEEARRAAQETQQAYNSAASSYKQNLSTYESNMKTLSKMSARYKELAKHVKDNGENVDLTDEEYQEFLELVDQIVAICPDAVRSYNDQGEAIKTGYVDALDVAIQKQQEFLEGQDKIVASSYLGMQGAWTDTRQVREMKGKLTLKDMATKDYYTGNMIDVSMATDALLLWNSLDQAMGDLGDKTQAFKDILVSTLHVDTSAFDSTLESIQRSEAEQVRMVNLYASAFSDLDSLKKALQESGQFTEEEIGKIYDLFLTGDWKFNDNKSWYGTWVSKQQEQIDNALKGLEAYFRIHSSEYADRIQGTMYNDMLEEYIRNTYDVTASASVNLKNAESYLNDLIQISEELEQIRNNFNQNYSRNGEDRGSLEVYDFDSDMTGAEYLSDALTKLTEKYQMADSMWIPILGRFMQSIQSAGEAAEESGEEAEIASTNYDKLSKTMDNAGSASSLIDKLRNGKATLEDLIPTLLKLTDAWNSAFPKDEKVWTDFAAFNEDGTINAEQTIALLEKYIDDMIALGTDGTEFAANYGAVLENLKAALKNGTSSEDVDELKSAFEEISELYSYLEELSSYKTGENNFFSMLQSAYEYAEKYKDDSINLSDLIRWDGDNKTIEFIDITDAKIDEMINTLATELNIGIDDLDAFRAAVKASFQDSAEEADTLGDAFDQVSDAFDYLKDIGSYRSGDKTLFDALESAYKYAKDNKGVNLSDLIKWDGENKTVEFIDLTDAAIDSMIDTLATELGIGIDDLETFRTSIRDAFKEASDDANALKDAFSAVSDAFDYIKDMASYRAGEKGLFEMLESAYDYAKNNEGINIADLIRWDDTTKTVEFVDLTDAAINDMIDTLATQLGIGEEHLAEFREAVKASFQDAADEAEALKNALSDVSDAFGYMKDIALYRSGDTSLFDMLESAYEYAENHEGVNLADLIRWDANDKSVQFIDLAEQSIDNMIDNLATELNIGIDDLESFRAAVKAAFEDAKEETDTLKDSLDQVSNAFSYMKDVAEYRSGDKTMFETLQSAYEYAKDHDNINIADLITWDDSAKSVQFVDLTEAAINDMIDTLAAELGIGEDKLADFRAAVRESFKEAAEDADELKTALTDVNDALTYMQNIASYKAGDKNFFDMLESAYEYAENHEGVNIGDLIKWDSGTKSVEFIDLAEQSIDQMIDTLATKLNIGIDDLESFRAAVKAAFEEAKEEADTLKEALTAISDAFTYIKNVASYGKGDKTLFDMLESAYEYAYNHEGINITDLIRWDGDNKAVEFIDIAEASIDAMIDKLASELNIGIDDLEAFRAAVKESFQEAADDADKLKDALSDVSQAFSYMKDISAYRAGEKNMFDMLQSAYDYASSHEGINLSDLIRWDESGKSVEFIDLTEAAIDQMIDTLANELNIGINDLEAFRAAVKAAFEGVADDANALKDAFSAVSDAFGYIKDISSYRDGEKTMFDMLESAYDYASKHEGVNLSDLIKWDSGTKSVQFIDLAEQSVDSMIDALAEKLEIGVDDLEAFRAAVKQSFEEAADEADKLENALNKVSNVFDYISKLSSYRNGKTTMFDMLEQAYSLAKQYEDISLSDLVRFDASGIQFKDIGEVQLDAFIRSLADELGVTGEAFDAFASQVKSSFAESEEAAKSMTEVLSDLSSAVTYLNDHASGSAVGEDLMSALSEFYALKEKFGDESWGFGDFFAWDEAVGDFVYKTDLLQSKVDTLASQIVSDLGLTGDAAEKATESIKNSFGSVVNEYEELAGLVNKVKNVNSFNETVESFSKGETGFIDMLSSSIEMAETFGLKIEDVFDFETMQPSAIAVTSAVEAAIDKMVEGKNYSADFVKQLKDAAKYSAEVESNQQKVNDAYETSSKRSTSASNFGRDTELTYETYKDLIADNAKYAQAIEYVNGKLTINKQKYWEVTKEINEETKALALQQAAQDRLKIDELNKQLAGLADQESDEAKQIRSRIQLLELEAKGYEVLANELDNATDAFARFAAASDSTEGSMHSAAQEAYNIISDTLKNKDSDRYGMIGNEKYKAAVDLVIGDIDVDDPAFETALAKVKRYFEDDKAGIKNFYSDMVNSGIIDATTGAFDTTITEISEKLGITKDAAKAMMQQLEQYSDEPFDWSKLDPEGIEDAAESAKTLNDQLDETKQKADDASTAVDDLGKKEVVFNDENAQTEVQSLSENIENITTYIDALNKKIVTISTVPARGQMNSLITSINRVVEKLKELDGKKVTVTVLKKEESSGTGEGEGEAAGDFVTKKWGFADARGSWRSHGGRTLVGELGPELVVDVARGRWYTVGDHGAEFVNLPQNSIVFNHLQTAQLLGRSQVSKLGSSMASGNAAAFSPAVTGSVQLPDDLVEDVNNNTNATEDLNDTLDELQETFEETNSLLEHYIAHAEQEYYIAERATDYAGMKSALGKEADYYQQIYENSLEAVKQLKAAGATENDEQLQEMEEAAWDAYQNMYDAIDKMRALLTDALDDEIDSLQNAFNKLKDVVDSYNENGKITIDQFQDLIDGGLQYLSLLKNENGEYEISTENVQALLEARKNQLAIETALSYVSRIREALSNGETETLNSLIDATQTLGTSTWDLVYAQLELARQEGLSDEQYEQAKQNIDNLKELAAIAEDDLTSEEDKLGQIKDTYAELNDQIEHYIKHLEQAQKVAERGADIGGQEEAIVAQIAKYQEIIDNAHKAIEEMKAEGADDTSEELQAMEEQAWSAEQSIWSLYDTLYSLRVEAVTSRLDDVQSAISDFSSAMEEINESGTLSLDTFQSILSNGLQYLKYLDIENGQLSLNRDAINEMIKARKNELAVETATSYLRQIREAAEAGEVQKLAQLVDLTDDLSKGTWALVDAELAYLLTEGKITEAQYEQIKSYFDKLKALADMVDSDIAAPEVKTLEETLAEILEQFQEIQEDIEHYIAHKEHEYKVAERAMDYGGMAASLQHQIDYYSQIYDQAMQTVQQLQAEGADDTSAELQEAEEAAWSAYDSMNEAFDQMNSLRVDALRDELSRLTGTYNTLKSAIDEFNEHGKISVDSFESILSGGLQYLTFLDEEDGHYKMSEESLRSYISARKEQLAIETAQQSLANIRQALQNGERERIKALIGASNDLSSSTWDLVFAQAAELKALGLTDEEYALLVENLTKLRDLGRDVESDLGAWDEDDAEPIQEIADAFEELNEQIEHYIAHQEQAYKVADRARDFSGMEESLRKEVEYYKQIMSEAEKAISDMYANGADDTDENLQKLEESYWSAYNSMYDALDKIRSLRIDALSEQIESMSTAATTLFDAMNSLNDSGTISLDTFTSLVNNGIQYLHLLQDENGQYKLSKDNIQRYLMEKQRQLAVETALKNISEIEEALNNGETERLKALIDATNGVSSSTWDMVFAKAAELKANGLSNEQYELLIENLKSLQDLSSKVSFDELDEEEVDVIGDLADAYSKLNSEIEHYIAHQEQAYKVADRARDFSGMEESLRKEVEYYKQIMSEAEKAISDMYANGADDTDENLQKVEEAYWSAYNSMYDVIDKMRALRVDAISDEINNLSGAFKNLKSAAEEYNDTGSITLDIFNSIIDGGMQYLSLLEEENGQYVISKDRLQDYIAARKSQLAIETALKYISELKEAADNGETERLNQLIDATNRMSESTWSLVYAQAAALKASGLSDEQYEQIIGNIDRLRAIAESVNTDLTESGESLSEQYDAQKNALDQILKYTEDLIRAEAKDQVQAIKDEIDAYKEIIQLKKDALEQTKNEKDYQEEVADKVEEIAKLQAKADMLALDTSRSAAAERQSLMQEILDKQQELSDYQEDHAYDAQTKALDDEAEAYEKLRQTEIDAIEESVASEERVYQLAIQRISEQWDTLYSDLIKWNEEQGSVINQEITDAWEEALKAVKKYGGYVAALSGIDTDSENSKNSLVVADLPKYHGGGVTGDKGKINDTEVLAVLEEGELVVDKIQKSGLYTVIDFVKTLGEKLGTKIGSLRNINIAGAMIPAFAGITTPGSAGMVENSNINFSPTFDVHIDGGFGDENAAKAFGRTIAETAANSLFDAFSRRGINKIQTLRQ